MIMCFEQQIHITLTNNYVSTATDNYYFELKGSFRTTRNYGFTGDFAFRAKPIDE